MKKIMMLIILCITVIPLVVGDTTTGIMSYWALDSNFTDSKTGNDFTATGNTVIVEGWAYFDGTDDFLFTSGNGKSAFPVTNDYTLCYFVNTTTTERDGVFTHGNNDMDTCGGFISEFRSTDPGQIRFSHDTTGANNLALTNVVFNDGNAQFICDVLDGLQLRLYKNNSNYQNATLDASYIKPTYALAFGGLRETNTSMIVGTYDFTGRIRGVTYYNRALTSSDISDLFSQDGDPGSAIIPFYIDNSTLNMTSDGGNVSWRTDKTVYVQTTDGTPNIVFNTNLASTCSIATEAHNYNASKICSTTGDTSHSCTVYNADKLIYGGNSLYASCYDGATYDTTGAMNINMTAGSPGNGTGLVSCISTIGSGCGAVISNNCASIIQ